MTSTPVVFIIFNRPHWASLVFQKIRLAKPQKLFVIADGPRDGYPEDASLIKKSLALLDTIDWDCELHVSDSAKNLGCGRRIAEGLSWVFDQVPSAIILEDDCVPDPSFFPFCNELLERYENEEQVMTISGSNYMERWHSPNSYFFGMRNTSHGWASWSRAWKHYDFTMSAWQDPVTLQNIASYMQNEALFQAWSQEFSVILDNFDTWCYQWTVCHLLNRRYAAVPTRNLVTHIGYGPDTTHFSAYSEALCVPSGPMPFPLIHPKTITLDRDYDAAVQWSPWSDKRNESRSGYMQRSVDTLKTVFGRGKTQST